MCSPCTTLYKVHLYAVELDLSAASHSWFVRIQLRRDPRFRCALLLKLRPIEKYTSKEKNIQNVLNSGYYCLTMLFFWGGGGGPGYK